MKAYGPAGPCPVPREEIPQVIGSYQVGEVIGTGAYGVVVSARHHATGDEVAIKVISRRLLDQHAVLGAFEQECRIHESLNHENISKVFGIVYEKDYVFVILELCRGGDLLDYITSNQSRPLRRVLAFFFQILRAVAYLHERGIAHLDIKPENVLLADDQTLKLGDFGCCEAPPKYDRGNARGTPKYSAPEILLCPRPDNRAADIWSLGILLFVLASGLLPFEAGTDDEITEQIIKGEMKFPLSMSPDIIQIVQECCQLDPEKRPLVTDLMAKPIFEKERAESEHPSPRARFGASEGTGMWGSTSSTSMLNPRKVVIARPVPILSKSPNRVHAPGSMSVKPRPVSGPGMLAKGIPRPFSPSPQPTFLH
jgi:serine/threonine protein kinase